MSDPIETIPTAAIAEDALARDRAAHDTYQDAPRHKQFIDENKDNWKKVRVFDSAVQP